MERKEFVAQCVYQSQINIVIDKYNIPETKGTRWLCVQVSSK